MDFVELCRIRIQGLNSWSVPFCVILSERQRVKDLPVALERLVDPSPRGTQFRMTLGFERMRCYATGNLPQRRMWIP